MSNKKEAVELLTDNLEKAMDLLVNACEVQAKSYGADHIPISYLKQAKKVIVDSYKEGVEG